VSLVVGLQKMNRNSQTESIKKTRYVELDILRIVSAFSIVLFHYTFRGFAADNMSILDFPYLGKIFKYGYLAIYAFFLLSGYVVVYSAQTKNFFEFVYSRIRRLYPSFWVAVLLTSFFTYQWGGQRYHVYLNQVLINLTMLNRCISIPSVDGVYWFLFEILKFYFYISMLILFRLLNKIDMFVFFWLIGVLIALLVPVGWKISFFLMPRYAPFLISGVIFFLIKQNGWKKMYIVTLAFSFVLGFFALVQNTPNMIEHYKSDFSIVVILFVIVLFYLVLALSVAGWLKLTSRNRIIFLLSASSYPLYLIHQNIGFIIFNYFGKNFNKYLLLIFTMCFVSILSILIVKYIEPLIKNRLDAIYRIFNSPTRKVRL